MCYNFSILGVQFFGNKFYKCVVGGEKSDPTIISNKTDCIKQYGEEAWQNSKINFDNTVMAFFALYQVVRNFIHFTRDSTAQLAQFSACNNLTQFPIIASRLDSSLNILCRIGNTFSNSFHLLRPPSKAGWK